MTAGSMGMELACESMGEGPPLIILHGLFGSGGNWRSLAKALATDRRVLLVDLRNHGASPWAESMSYPEMADDVLRLIARERLERPTLVGHSMGGKVAMTVALQHPERVRDLVVVDVAPVNYADRLSPFAEAMRAIDMIAAASRSEVQQRLASLVPDAGVVPFLMQNLVTRNSHLDWRINLAAIAASIQRLSEFPAELRHHRHPGLLQVIAGARSDYVPLDDGSDYRPMFERTRVTRIDGAGHWVHADRPADFLQALRAALQAGRRKHDAAPVRP